jgi:phage FluMu gp28-like protein
MELISTHRGSQNFFNELIREVREKNNPKKISLHRVTLQDALEQGFLFKLQQKLALDDPIQAMDEAAYFDFIKSGCADSESFEQEYCCNPADDNAAFLEYGLIASCEYPSGQQWEISYGEFAATAHQRQFYAGLDIGRTHDLTVLWIVEKLGDTLYTRKVITLKGMAKPDQEKVLYPWLEHLRRACFDYTGLGIGWGDDALRKFGKSTIELVTFTGRIKEEMAFALRGRFEDKTIRIPYDNFIRADLRAVKKQLTTSGNIRFIAESSENGHADRFWAVALAVLAASTPSLEIEFASSGVRSTHRALDDERKIKEDGFGSVSGSNDFSGW